MRKIFVFIFSLIFFLSLSLPALAADGINASPLKGSTCLYEKGGAKVVTFDCVPVLFINFIFYAIMFAGLVALVLIIFSGIKFIMSGGDPKQVEGARNTATWAIIGLVVVFFSFAIVRFISDLTGVECLTQIGIMACKPT